MRKQQQDEHMCDGYDMRVLFTENEGKKDQWEGITEKKRSGIFLCFLEHHRQRFFLIEEEKR
jgi:hypothetical protein